MSDVFPLSIGRCVTLACVLEATAPKPGNVHRGADFDDVTFPDFLCAGVIIGPLFDCAAERRPGRTILDAVRATQSIGVGNTNLGMILLLAPLAAVPRDVALRTGVREVLAGLDAEDAANVYAAIRLAQPGGLGQAAEMDVHAAAPPDLIVAMTAAADRDRVARQYAVGFADIFDEVLPRLTAGLAAGRTLTSAIIRTHVELIAEFGDSLIHRKCGPETNAAARRFAQACVAAGLSDDDRYHEALSDFDFWLRADGRRRNPGTTADLIAAGLFAGLRDGLLPPPWR